MGARGCQRFPEVGQNIALHAVPADRNYMSAYIYLDSAFPIHSAFVFPNLECVIMVNHNFPCGSNQCILFYLDRTCHG